MKSLSTIFTVLLLVVAYHLAVRLRQAGALPAAKQEQQGAAASQLSSFSNGTSARLGILSHP